MGKFIKVYDNIIPPPLSEFVEESVIKSGEFPFNYKEKFQKYHPIHSPEASSLFGFGNTYIKEGEIQDKNLVVYNQILYQASVKLNFIIKDIITARVWLTTPQEKNHITIPHRDLPYPHLVCLYYINDIDGDTLFFEDDKSTIFKKISPKKGRVVVFDGSIFHAPCIPTINPRAVINYNFNTI